MKSHPLFPANAGDSPNCFWTEVSGQPVHVQGNPNTPSDVFSALQQMIMLAFQAVNRGEILTQEQQIEKQIMRAAICANESTEIRSAIERTANKLSLLPIDASTELKTLREAEQALYKLLSDYHSQLCKQYQALP